VTVTSSDPAPSPAPEMLSPPADTESVESLLRQIADLRRENDQLRTALTSRIVIEQAKGILAERHLLLPDQAFEAMRGAARHERRRLHDLAREVIAETHTPPEVARRIQDKGGFE
jgi:hypothetical protein